MKILLTGNRGMIGAVIETELQITGHEVMEYDLLDGLDILDVSSLERAIRGCDAVIHLASPLGDPGDSPHETMRAIVQGTWNVLLAGEKASVRRVVYMSSVDALGVFKEEMGKTNANIIGEWPIEGYRFTDSDGYDGKMFFGLALDEDRQEELTVERAAKWVADLKAATGI